MAIVEARGVNKTYTDLTSGREIHALENISLSVEENDFLILLGPSGCGKSTLLNIIAGLIPHDGGDAEVLVEGNRVTGPKPKLMAYMFQDPVLYPWRTVIKNVEFGLEAQKVSKEERRRRAMKYINMVGLDDFVDSYPRQLSGGMCQRTALCRSLALETDILLMDEPFGALDEQSRIILGDELVDIWKKLGRTIVFVTHSLSEAVYLGERILLFTARPGKIKTMIKNDLPRPRVMGSLEFNQMIDRIWADLKVESMTAMRREKVRQEEVLVPKE